MMGAMALDYANWDAAFDNISVNWDQQWVVLAFLFECR